VRALGAGFLFGFDSGLVFPLPFAALRCAIATLRSWTVISFGELTRDGSPAPVRVVASEC
jgi:hypothetical protein